MGSGYDRWPGKALMALVVALVTVGIVGAQVQPGQIAACATRAACRSRKPDLKPLIPWSRPT